MKFLHEVVLKLKNFPMFRSKTWGKTPFPNPRPLSLKDSKILDMGTLHRRTFVYFPSYDGRRARINYRLRTDNTIKDIPLLATLAAFVIIL